jgi:hypothetical protein
MPGRRQCGWSIAGAQQPYRRLDLVHGVKEVDVDAFAEPITGTPTRDSVPAQHRTQTRDQRGDVLGDSTRRSLPQRLSDRLDTGETVGPHGEQGEQQACLATADGLVGHVLTTATYPEHANDADVQLGIDALRRDRGPSPGHHLMARSTRAQRIACLLRSCQPCPLAEVARRVGRTDP